MATPKSVVTVLNAIRNTATDAYQSTVPLATMESFTQVGASVLSAPDTIKNEFLNALINKVGLQLFNEKEFGNPLSFLQKGTLEYGQTIEDIFIEMSKPFEYVTGTRVANPDTGALESTPDQFAINKSIAETAYYYNIFGRQYWQTIHENDLKRAFTSAEGLGRLISAIMLAMKNGESYDDYRMAIAIIAKQIEIGATQGSTPWKGRVDLLTEYNKTVDVDITADDELGDKNFLQFMSNQFKKWSNRLTKPRKDLNNSGVTNWVPASEQRIMMLSDIQADIDTNLMAWAYNNDRLEIGAIDQIDAWYSIGADSESAVTADDIVIKGTLGISEGDPSADVPVLAVIYDPNMVKIYNKTRQMSQAYNARGLYYNVFSTCEDIYAASPFHNYVAFTLA